MLQLLGQLQQLGTLVFEILGKVVNQGLVLIGRAGIGQLLAHRTSK
jgi:hypothetical protein